MIGINWKFGRFCILYHHISREDVFSGFVVFFQISASAKTSINLNYLDYSGIKKLVF